MIFNYFERTFKIQKNKIPRYFFLIRELVQISQKQVNVFSQVMICQFSNEIYVGIGMMQDPDGRSRFIIGAVLMCCSFLFVDQRWCGPGSRSPYHVHAVCICLFEHYAHAVFRTLCICCLMLFYQSLAWQKKTEVLNIKVFHLIETNKITFWVIPIQNRMQLLKQKQFSPMISMPKIWVPDPNI